MDNLSMSKFASQKDYWEARAKQAEAQRDELAAALRPMTGGLAWLTSEHVEAARRALAKVQG